MTKKSALSDNSPMRKSVKVEEIEVGFYPAGADVIVYVNFKGICVHRERVKLPEALASDSPVGIDVLRNAAHAIEIDHIDASVIKRMAKPMKDVPEH